MTATQAITSFPPSMLLTPTTGNSEGTPEMSRISGQLRNGVSPGRGSPAQGPSLQKNPQEWPTSPKRPQSPHPSTAQSPRGGSGGTGNFLPQASHARGPSPQANSQNQVATTKPSQKPHSSAVQGPRQGSSENEGSLPQGSQGSSPQINPQHRITMKQPRSTHPAVKSVKGDSSINGNFPQQVSRARGPSPQTSPRYQAATTGQPQKPYNAAVQTPNPIPHENKIPIPRAPQAQGSSPQTNSQDQITTAQQQQKPSPAAAQELGPGHNESGVPLPQEPHAQSFSSPTIPQDPVVATKVSGERREQQMGGCSHSNREGSREVDNVGTTSHNGDTARASRDESKEDHPQLQKTMGSSERQRELMMKNTNDVSKRLNESEIQRRGLEDSLRRQSERISVLESQLRQAEAQHRETADLLEIKSSELRGAEAFLSKADSLSGADVIGIVETLNSEIFQTAALMAESLGDLDREYSSRPIPEGNARERWVRLGEPVVQALRYRRRGHDFDPMPMQIALQICLVNLSVEIVRSWNLGPEYDRKFSSICSHIKRKDGQIIGGRWQGMTRNHIRRLQGPDRSKATLMSLARSEVEFVFALAGHPVKHLSWYDFHKKFQGRLEMVVDLALRLQEAVGEAIVSVDMEAIIVRPGDVFDPQRMEDTFQSGRTSTTVAGAAQQLVAGTTDIGMRRLNPGNTPVATLLKKPKVVLVSVLHPQTR